MSLTETQMEIVDFIYNDVKTSKLEILIIGRTEYIDGMISSLRSIDNSKTLTAMNEKMIRDTYTAAMDRILGIEPG